MLRFYPLVIILQLFCVYHAFKNNAEQKWYWIIMIFPIGGSLIYLYHHFGNRQTVTAIAKSVAPPASKNPYISGLEKEYTHNDCAANRIALADAYVETGRNDDAIVLYERCLVGYMANDPEVLSKMVHAHYNKKDYKKTIEYADKLAERKSFTDSPNRIRYAWALYHEGDIEKAEATFADMDTSFTNYEHRTEYCRFLIKNNRDAEAKEKLTTLLNEFNRMDSHERRDKKTQHDIVRTMFDAIKK